MADQIREYVIKIRAEVQDALSQIDQLKGKFDKIEVKTKIDKGFESSIEKLSGSIGKITQEMGDLKSAFKEVDFKSFTGDMKSSFDDLKSSIDDIKSSAKTLAEAFDFSGKSNNGFQNFANDLKSQITDLVKNYSDAVQQIQDMTANGFVPKSNTPTSKGDIATSLAKQSEQLSDTASGIGTTITKSRVQIQKALSELEEIAEQYKSVRDRISTMMQHGTEMDYDPMEVEQLLSVVNKLEEVSKRTKRLDSKKTDEILFNLGIDKGKTAQNNTFSRTRKSLENLRQRAIDTLSSDTDKQVVKTKVQFQVDYDVLNSDDPKEQAEYITRIVNQIRTNVQEKVNKEMMNHPIRIPITFGSYDKMKEQIDKATKDTGKMVKEISDEKHQKAIINELQLKVTAVTDGLIDDINTKIKEINSQISTSIDVPINPIVPGSQELSKAISKTEEAVKDKITDMGSDKGIPVDFSGIIKSSTGTLNVADVKTHEILSSIQGVTEAILGKMGSFPPGGGGGSYPTTRNTPSVPPSPPSGGGNVTPPNIQNQIPQVAMQPKLTQASAQSPVIKTTKDVKVDGSKVTVQQPKLQSKPTQEPQQTTLQRPMTKAANELSLETLLQSGLKSGPSKPPRSSNQIVNRAKNATIGFSTNKWMTGLIDASKQNTAKRLGQDLLKAGVDELLKDIIRGTETPETIKKAPYYNATYGNGKYAYYGLPGQTIEQYQTTIDRAFREATQNIDDDVNAITKKFAEAIQSGDLVDAGVKGLQGIQISRWRKLLLDDDSSRMESELTGENFEKRMAKINKEDPSFFDRMRKTLPSETNKQLIILRKEQSELSDFLEENFFEYERQFDAKDSILDLLKKSETQGEFKQGYKKLNIIAKDIIDGSEDLQNLLALSGESYVNDRQGVIDQLANEITELQREIFEKESRYSKEIFRYNQLTKDSIPALETRSKQLASGSNQDVLKEVIKMEHADYRKDLLHGTGQRTKEYDKKLQELQEREIERIISADAKQAIIEAFNPDILKPGQTQLNPFKGAKKENVSMIDLKSPAGQKKARELESVGIKVDENGNIMTFSGQDYDKNGNLIDGYFGMPQISANWNMEDLQQRVKLVAEIGQMKLDEQIEFTKSISQNEQIYKEYADYYKKLIQDTHTNEDIDYIHKHYEDVASLLRIESKGVGSLDYQMKNLGDDYEARDRQESVLRLFGKKGTDIYGNARYDSRNVYDAVVEQLSMINESRKRERQIYQLFNNQQKRMVDADANRFMSKDTYKNYLKELEDLDKEYIKYRNRMQVTNKGADPSSLTPYEYSEYDRVYNRRRELKNKVYAYEIGNGYRDLNGRLIADKSLNPNGTDVTKFSSDQSLKGVTVKVGSLNLTAKDPELAKQWVGLSEESSEEQQSVVADKIISMLTRHLKSLPKTEKGKRNKAIGMLKSDIKDLEDQLQIVNQELEANKKYNEENAESINKHLLKAKSTEGLQKKGDSIKESIEMLQDTSGKKSTLAILKDQLADVQTEITRRTLSNEFHKGDIAKKIRKPKSTYELETIEGDLLNRITDVEENIGTHFTPKVIETYQQLEELKAQEQKMTGWLAKRLEISDKAIEQLIVSRDQMVEKWDARQRLVNFITDNNLGIEKGNLGKKNSPGDNINTSFVPSNVYVPAMGAAGNINKIPVLATDLAEEYQDLFDDYRAVADQATIERQILTDMLGGKDNVEELLDIVDSQFKSFTQSEIEELRRNREKQEVLANDIREQIYQDTVSGKNGNYREQRIQNYISKQDREKQDVESALTRAKYWRGDSSLVHDAMVATRQRELEEAQLRREKEVRMVAETSKKENELAEKRVKAINQLDATNIEQLKNIHQEREDVVESVYQGVNKLNIALEAYGKQINDRFEQAQIEVKNAQSAVDEALQIRTLIQNEINNNTYHQVSKQEALAMQNPEEAHRIDLLTKKRTELINQANAEGTKEDKRNRILNTTVPRFGKEIDKIETGIVISIKGSINKLMRDLRGAVKSGLPKKDIETIADELLEKREMAYAVGFAKGEFRVPGFSPFEYIEKEFPQLMAKYDPSILISQTAEQLNQAEEDLRIAQQNLDVAQRAVNLTNGVKGITASGDKLAIQYQETKDAIELKRRELKQAGQTYEQQKKYIETIGHAKNQLELFAKDGDKNSISHIQSYYKTLLDDTIKSYRNYLAKRIDNPLARNERIVSEEYKDSITGETKTKYITRTTGDKLKESDLVKPKESGKSAKEIIANIKAHKKTVEEEAKAQSELLSAQKELDVIRLEESKTYKETSKKMQKLHDDRIAAVQQERVDNFFDWKYANMTDDQAQTSYLINKFIDAKNRNGQLTTKQESWLADLQKAAIEKLGLTLDKSGKVNPFISKEDYEVDSSAYTLPQMSREELIRRRLIKPQRGKKRSKYEYATFDNAQQILDETDDYYDPELLARIYGFQEVAENEIAEHSRNIQQSMSQSADYMQMASEEIARQEVEAKELAARGMKLANTMEETKLPSKPVVTPSSEISLSQATSRDDYVNRIKTGVEKGMLLGVKEGAGTMWFHPRNGQQQMQEMGYADVTKVLAPSGKADIEAIGMLADRYYQSADASSSAAQATEGEAKADQALTNASNSATAALNSQAEATGKVVDIATKQKELEQKKQTQQQPSQPQLKKETRAAAPEQPKVNAPVITKDGVDFNGKHYSLIPKDQQISLKNENLKGVFGASKSVQRGRQAGIARSAANNILQYLQAYSQTGNYDFLDAIESQFTGNGKSKGLYKKTKEGVRRFVSGELAKRQGTPQTPPTTLPPQPKIEPKDVAPVQQMAEAHKAATKATDEQIQKTEQLKALLKDLNAGEFREQVGGKYKQILGELTKEGSTLTPEDAANQVRAYLGELRSSSKSPKGSTSAFLEKNGIKQIPGLTSEQQAEYDDWVSEILARGAEDVRVSAMTWEDVQKELDELETKYIAIGQASIGSTGKAATGIDQIEQEAKEATPAVIDLKNALESIGQIYSLSGREGLLSSLTALSAKDMRKIAEDNGYVNARGKLPKSLNKTQLAGLIADNYEKGLTPALTETKAQAESQIELYDNLGRKIDKNKSKFLETTKLIDAQNNGIMTLFHSSNDIFERFDSSKMGESGRAFGNGAYFSTTPQLIYGNKMTEWYGLAQKPFSYASTILSDDEISKIIQHFYANFSEEITTKARKSLKSGYYDDLFSQELLTRDNEAIKNGQIRYIAGSPFHNDQEFVDNAIKYLGYDSLEVPGGGIVLFNLDNIIRANNIVHETVDEIGQLVNNRPINSRSGMPMIPALKDPNEPSVSTPTTLPLEEESKAQQEIGTAAQQSASQVEAAEAEKQNAIEQTNEKLREQQQLEEQVAKYPNRPEKYRNLDITAIDDKELNKLYGVAKREYAKYRKPELHEAWGSFKGELEKERGTRPTITTPQIQDKGKDTITKQNADQSAQAVVEAEKTKQAAIEETTAKINEQKQAQEQLTTPTANQNKPNALIDYYKKYYADWDAKKMQEEASKMTTGMVDSFKAGGRPGFKFTGSEQQLEYIQAINTELEKMGYQLTKVQSGDQSYVKVSELSAATEQATQAMTNEATAADTAKQSLEGKATAEQQAAEGAKQNAQASQQVADTVKPEASAKKVSTQEQKQPSKIDEIISSYKSVAQNVGGLVEGESTDFGSLLTMLRSTIPQAVDIKNKAFMQEAQLVQQLATEEATAFQPLVENLQKIAGLATNLKFDFRIQGGEQFTSEFIEHFGELKKEIDGVDPSKFETIGKAVTSMGSGFTANQDLVKTFEELGNAVKTFAQNVDSTELYGNFNQIAGMVERIAMSGDKLKNMADILKKQKPGKYSADAQMDAYVTEFKKQIDFVNSPDKIAKYAKISLKQQAYEKAVAEGGDLTQSNVLMADESAFLADYNNRLDMINQLGNSIARLREEFNSLGKSSLVPEDVLNSLGKTVQDLGVNINETTAQAEAYSKVTKDYSAKLAGMQEKINLIPEEEQKAYAGAFGQLKSTFADASEELKSGGIVWEQYTARMNAAWQAYNRFKKANPAGSINFGSASGSVDDVRNQIQSMLQQRYKLVTQNVSGGAIDSNGMAKFSAQVVDAQNNVQNLKITWDTFSNSLSASANTAAEQFKGRFMSLFTDLQAKSKQLFVYWTATFLNPYRLIDVVKQVVNIVKELDTAMMELRKVSSETADRYKDFQTKSFSMADEVGGTAKDIITATTNWKKLGKSFEEAQMAGQASVKLLNVSEFQNIDDATTALVSMKQAFNDLSYDDFIDKLNAVGDSYSSATDQLAEGMKNVSAVMKVQGNDIDQTLALLTAANDVTQDISKAAMGIRTVALRMAGTQEAKQQLEDLGEDTSDFIVQTQSKVDEKVRKYTATASNPQGISVLADNGRQRDTYDVLLDISRVWDEIIAKDEEFGTNTSNALLELLAGKTRSNVLASVLQNPELLEQAYTTSQNAAGTGQKELDIYLDSIQAKTTQITNNLQQLASSTVDTGGFKTLLDIVNGLLTAVNQLTDAFGGLNVAIGAIAGIQLQKHGLGAAAIINSFRGDNGAFFSRKEFVNKDVAAYLKGYSPTTMAFGENGILTGENLNKAPKAIQDLVAKNTAEQNQNLTVAGIMRGTTRVQEGWRSYLKNMFGNGPDTRTVKQMVIHPLSDKLQDAMKTMGEGDASNKVASVMMKNNMFGKSWIEELDDTSQTKTILRSALQDEEMTVSELNASLMAANRGFEETEVAVGGVSKAFGVASKIGGTFISTLGSMAMSMAAMWVIQGVITLINDFATASERAIEAGKEAQKTISEISTNNKNEKKSISEIRDEYAKLSTGVKADKGKVTNVNLSDAEFERYLELSKQIADLSPQLVSGYDNQGNAIVNLGNTVEGVNDKFQEYLDLQQQIANIEIGDNLDTVWKGITEQADKYQNKLDGFNKTISEAAEARARSIEIIDSNGEYADKITNDTMSITVQEADRDTVMQLFRNAGVEIQQDEGITGTGTAKINILSGLSDLDEDNSLFDALNTYYGRSKSVTQHKANVAEVEAKKTKLLLDKTYQEVIPAVQEYIAGNSIFDEIGDEAIEESLRTGFSDMMSRIDYASIRKDVEKAKGLQNWLDNMIATMSLDDEDVQDAFNQLFDLEKKRGEMTYKEYAQKRNALYQYLEDKVGEEYLSTNQLAIMMGQATQDEEGNIHWNTKDRIAAAKAKVGFDEDSLFGKAFSGVINRFDAKYSDQALAAIESMPQKQAEKIAGNYDAVMNYIMPYLTGEKYKDELKSGTLAEMLADEAYQGKAEDYSTNLSTLESALETLRNGEELTLDTTQSLIEKFPDLADSFKSGFELEGLTNQVQKELEGWGKIIGDAMKDMSPVEKGRAGEYLDTIIGQYKDVVEEMSSQDALNAFLSSGAETSMSTRIEETKQYNEAIQALKESGLEDIDYTIVWRLALSDQLSGDAEQIRSNYDNVSLTWEVELKKQHLEDDIEYLQAKISGQEAKNSRKEASGGVVTRNDLVGITEYARGIAEDRRQQYLADKKRYEANKFNTPKHRQQLEKNMLESEATMNEAYADVETKEKAQIEAFANGRLKQLEKRENDLTEAQNALTEAENKYGEGNAPKEFYDNVREAFLKRGYVNGILAGMYEQMAKDNPQYAEEFRKKALDYSSSAQSDTESAKGYENAEQQKNINKLQENATKLQRELTVAEQKHQKVSKQTYKDLIQNAKAQINELRKEQDGVKNNITEWRNYQDQIDSLSDSIYDWSNTMDTLVVDQATNLASAISSAMEESMSETGLTNDTINNLVAGFSDVLGKDFDMSDMFYNTTDGVKVNTDALRELTEAEFDLQATNLADEIQRTQDALNENEGDSALEQQLDGLMQKQAEFFAQYEEMKKSISDFNALTLAQSTTNQGAEYDSIYGTYSEMQKAYEKGLVGTDDFKAFTAYADKFGRDTYEAFEAVKPKLDRYLTEDGDVGTDNFLQDLKQFGYAEQDAEGVWDIRVKDLNQAAQDLGIGTEFFESLMGKLEEYDFTHIMVNSLTEAELSAQGLQEELKEARQTYIDMLKAGASEEDLAAQWDVIKDKQEQLNDLSVTRQDYLATEEKQRQQEYLSIDKTIAGYQKMYDEAIAAEKAATEVGNDWGVQEAKKTQQSIVGELQHDLDKYGYKVEVEAGKIKLSDDALADFQSRLSKMSIDFTQYNGEYATGNQGKINDFQQYYDENKEAAQGYLSTLSELSEEELKQIVLSDKQYNIDNHEAEDALQGLADALGYTNEDMGLLVDLIGLAREGLSEIEVPDAFREGKEAAEAFLNSDAGKMFTGFDLDSDVSKMEGTALENRIKTLKKIKEQTGTEADEYLDSKIQEAEVQLDIKAKLDSDYTLSQLKDLAQDETKLAEAFNIDVNTEEGQAKLAELKSQIDGMSDGVDMIIRVDDTQFEQLIEAITGEDYEAWVKFHTDDQEVTTTEHELKSQEVVVPVTYKMEHENGEVPQNGKTTGSDGHTPWKSGKQETIIKSAEEEAKATAKYEQQNREASERARAAKIEEGKRNIEIERHNREQIENIRKQEIEDNKKYAAQAARADEVDTSHKLGAVGTGETTATQRKKIEDFEKASQTVSELGQAGGDVAKKTGEVISSFIDGAINTLQSNLPKEVTGEEAVSNLEQKTQELESAVNLAQEDTTQYTPAQLFNEKYGGKIPSILDKAQQYVEQHPIKEPTKQEEQDTVVVDNLANTIEQLSQVTDQQISDSTKTTDENNTQIMNNLQQTQNEIESFKDKDETPKKLDDINVPFNMPTMSTPLEQPEVSIGSNTPTASVIAQDSTLIGSSQDAVDTSLLLPAIANYISEYKKALDAGFEQEFNTGFSSTYGNIDMNDRPFIQWTETVKQKYSDALNTWEYNPALGSQDTVHGGSDRFGEDILETGVEVAFTPMMKTEDGSTEFLGKDTVYNYIEDLVGKATENGQFSEEKLLAMDADKQHGGLGIIAGADTSLNYDRYDPNANKAFRYGEMMHFAGDYGAKQLATNQLNTAGIDEQFVQSQMQSLEALATLYEQDAEKAQGYFDVLMNTPTDELQQIILSNGVYDNENVAAENALQGIADQAGMSKEEILQLIDAIKQLNQQDVEQPELPEQPEQPTSSRQPEQSASPTEVPETGEGEERIITFRAVVEGDQVQSDVAQIQSDVENTDVEITPKLVVTDLLSKAQSFISSLQNKVSGAMSSGQPSQPQTTETTATMDTSGVDKGAAKVDKAMNSLGKETATARVNVDIGQAMAAISSVRANLMTISGISVNINANSSSLVTAAGRAANLSQKLSEVIAKKNQAGMAAGTAHANGTVGIGCRINGIISHAFDDGTVDEDEFEDFEVDAYADGSGQDWAIGKNEKALVNEIGQESLV